MMIRRRIAEGWCVQISHAEFSEEILHNAARAILFEGSGSKEEFEEVAIHSSNSL
jgi:hypothetical protein